MITMRTMTFRRSVTRYMIAAAVLPLLIVAAAGWYAVGQFQTSALMKQNRYYAQAIEARVSGYLTRTEVLVNPYGRSSYRTLQTNPYFEGLWQQRVDSIVPLESMLLLNETGQVVFAAVAKDSHAPANLLEGLDKSWSPEYRLAQETQAPVWSDVHLSPLSGEPLLAYVYPMETGTIVLELSLANLGSAIGPISEGVTPVVVDRHGVVVFHPDSDVLKLKPNIAAVDFVKRALGGAEDEATRFQFEGATYLAVSEPMPSTGWVLLAMRHVEDVGDVVLRSQLWLLLLLLLSLGFSTFIAATLSGALARPVDDLARHVSAVAEGNYEISHTTHMHEEFGILAGALETMSNAVREREEGIAVSARRFRFLVESLNAIPWEFDVDAGHFIYVGPQAEEILGYPAEYWTDLDSWVALIHSDDRDRALSETQKGIADRRDHDHSYRMISASGETRFIHDIVSVIDHPNSSVRLVGVLIDVTSVREVEELKLAAEVADAASQAKSSFLAYMSHELRTPLNSIIGFSQIMLDGLTGQMNEEQTRQLGMIRRSGAHLMALVNDVLDLEKIEQGAIEFEYSAVDMAVLVATSVDGLMPQADRKRLSVKVDVPDRPMICSVDEDRVRQVLLNLLSNAIKYTDKGGVHVVLKVSAVGGIEVSVADTGPGIATELLDEIFNEFRCIGRSGDALQESTGLGLAISRRLARLMGGDILVESVVSEGSVFTLALPHRD
jgi:PAS domain S-box-containing protein